MRKCCFIIPYFGTFPNYFALFLKTCAWNSDFNWLIVTDNKTDYSYPKNVQVKFMQFRELRELVNRKFGFYVALNDPYKLCDLKPAYGFIFEDYVVDYRFWGHCDVDTLMGDLSSFITDDMLNTYDKIFCLGHMTLYKNSNENNRVFMSKYKDEFLYKKVFLDDEILVFDEEWKNEKNVNQIFLSQGKKVYQQDLSLNFSIFISKFVRTVYRGIENYPMNHGYELESYKNALYVWDNGHVYRYYENSNEIVKEEFLYMHLQQRKMKVTNSVFNCDIIKIVPNKFSCLKTKEITISNFYKIKKNGLCFQAFRTVYMPKIERFLKRFLSK